MSPARDRIDTGFRTEADFESMAQRLGILAGDDGLRTDASRPAARRARRICPDDEPDRSEIRRGYIN